MFKKSLIATALLASAGAANAATLTVAHADDAGGDSVVRISEQYAASSAAAAQADVKATIALDAAYSAGDIITITVSGGSLDSTVTGTTDGILNAITATANAGADTIALGLLSQEDGKLTYRVTSAQGDTDLLSVVINTPLKKDHMTNASGVAMTYAAETSTGIDIDVAKTNSATVVSFFDQYGLKVATKASAKIDVATLRETFVDTDTGTGVEYNEDITLTVTDLQVGDDVNASNTAASDLADLVATSVKAKYTLSGDFSWMTTTTTGDGTALDTTAGEIAVSHTTAATVSAPAFDSDGNITFTVTDADLGGDIEIDFTVPQNDFVIPVQSFAVAEVKTFDTDKTESVSDVAAGSWTLNGANVNVPYMPYGSTISQILYITNSHTAAGDISVIATDEDGETYDLGIIGSAAPGVNGIAGSVRDALPADFSGKLSLDITVNAPDSAITVYAAYNVGGSDRGTINTSQYKK